MKVGSVNNLFPLNLIEHRLGGYFINAAGEIFSTQLNAEPRKMLGNRGSNGTRFYTLNRVSYSGAQLLQRAKADPNFARETTPEAVALANVLATRADPHAFAAASLQRNHARSVAEGITNRGVVLASVKDGKLVFGSEPAIHTTEASYRAEMQRLAAQNPGTKIVALKIVASVEAAALVWS